MGPNGLTDSEVILMVRRGQKDAFRTIIERYWTKIHNLIRRSLSDSFLVEDLCQETFLKAFDKIDQFDESRSFTPWLCKIALNLLTEHFRRAGTKLQFLSFDGRELQGTTPCPSEKVEGKIRLDEFLNALPISLRIVFILKHGLMMSCEDISHVFDEPVGTIKGNLYRAREILKTYYLRDAEILKAQEESKPR